MELVGGHRTCGEGARSRWVVQQPQHFYDCCAAERDGATIRQAPSPQIVCLLRFDICLSQRAGLFQVAEALDGRAEDHGAGGDGHPESAGGTERVYQPA